jgi:transcriptional regulator of arginine metabolism
MRNTDKKRRDLLKRIIESNSFSKQETLVKELKKLGFNVTQSSISRDLQIIGAVKVAGKYCLSIPRPRKITVRGLVRSIDTAGANLVVVKTNSGAANVVAAALDGSDIIGMVGTVAGDDTFFIATKNKVAQSKVLEALRRL